MKRVLFIFLITFVMVLSSCRVKETYKLIDQTDEISYVSIVKVSIDETGEIEQTELTRIDNIEAFIDDFYSIDCYVYFGDPTGINSESIVIKIEYNCGDYELINWNGQANYTSENGMKFYAGYSVFDETEYWELINKYLNEE